MTTATKRGVARIIEYRERWKGVQAMLKQAPEPNPVMEGVVELMIENDQSIIDAAEGGKPLLSSWYGSAPEIYAAMGIPYFCPVDSILAHMNMTNNHDVNEMDKTPFPSDVCSLIKLSAYAVEVGIVPTPSAIIAMLEPCDGLPALHESWNTGAWRGVPMISLDPPYGSSDKDFTYFAGELKRMISFLEEHTGTKLDYDKLRAVTEETNRQYATWGEYNELRRAKPCPHPSFLGSAVGWGITQHIRAGHPKATEILKMLVYDAEQKVKAGVGAVPNERIRILWADLTATWGDELAAWMAAEFGANVVMDFQGYTPYTQVDCTSEESMMFGLARRSIDEVPMIRQARGTVDRMIEDVTRIVKDYQIDAVFFPGHMGHKDQSASLAFLRETCRDLGVPLLTLTTSLFDRRYTPLETIKKQVSEFFSVSGLV